MSEYIPREDPAFVEAGSEEFEFDGVYAEDFACGQQLIGDHVTDGDVMYVSSGAFNNSRLSGYSFGSLEGSGCAGDPVNEL